MDIRKSPKLAGLIIALALSAVVLVLMALENRFPFFNFMELKALDMRFKVRGERPPRDDSVIVAIDVLSIESLGRWPWPRNHCTPRSYVLLRNPYRVRSIRGNRPNCRSGRRASRKKRPDRPIRRIRPRVRSLIR